MNKKTRFTAIWMFLSVAIIYFVLDKLVLTPVFDWISSFFAR